jgi:hypothetical protein
LIKKRSKVEKFEEEMAQIKFELKELEQMNSRPAMYSFDQTRTWYNDTTVEVKKLKRRGTRKNADNAIEKAIGVEKQNEMESMTRNRAWSRQNLGENVMEYGEADTQKIFEQFAVALKKIRY